MAQLWGMNITGGEGGSAYGGISGNAMYGTPEGNTAHAYVYPPNSWFDYLKRRGMNFARICLVQHRFMSGMPNIDPANDIAILRARLTYAESLGITILIDAHGAGQGNGIGKTGSGKVIGASPEANAEFVAEWRNFATIFKDKPNWIFGLTNEPHAVTAAQWLVAANAAIAAIREVGCTNRIYVPGSYWDGAWSWIQNDNDTVMPGVVDPLNNFAFEVHQYLDRNGAGQPDVRCGWGRDSLIAITNWARAGGWKLCMGELGFTGDDYNLNEGKAACDFLRANADVWESVAFWSMGAWEGQMQPSGLPYYWRPNDPVANWDAVIDKPQMKVILDPTPGPYLVKASEQNAALAACQAAMAAFAAERDAAKAVLAEIKSTNSRLYELISAG